MSKNIFLVFSILFLSTTLQAQDSRSPGVDKLQSPQNFKVHYHQYLERLEAFNNHPINLYYDRLIVEYQERMKANVKKYKVMARKMKKPQYSDPSYFGHKRKPKKRPVGKRKYCKECEIVH
jgi:hypothetical protein